MNKLKKKDLKTGDILIYEVTDFSYLKFIEKLYSGINNAIDYSIPHLISWFDPGKDKRAYFHAAIWNGEEVIEAGPGGIHKAPIEKDVTHPTVKNIYVYRYDKPTSEDKFIEAFKDFPASEKRIGDIGYSYPTAFLLAVLVSMRKGSINSILRSYLGTTVAKIFEGAFIHWVNGILSERPREMVVCSTLVSMIYQEAGYDIRIDLPNHQASSDAAPELTADIQEKLEAAAVEINEKHPLSVEASLAAADDTIVLVTPRQLAESTSTDFLGVVDKSPLG